MTKNQIEYWRNVETERHNRELEAQGREAIRVQQENARIAAATQSETVRSNQAREYETNRSNVAHEQNEILRTNETIRSNQASEAIGRTQAAASMIQAGASVTQAKVAQTNATTRRAEQKESVRHNYASEKTQANNNPWVSVATTLQQVVPRVADWATTQISNLRSISASYAQPRKITNPVSSYNR